MVDSSIVNGGYILYGCQIWLWDMVLGYDGVRYGYDIWAWDNPSTGMMMV